MWRIFSPYNLVDPDNPVFQQEQRRLRWLKTPENLRGYNLKIWIGIPALILLWWFIERFYADILFRQSVVREHFPLVLMIAMLGTMLLSSLYMIIASVGCLHRQFHARDWETLRLTNLPETVILAAKDAIARIRAWPPVAVEIGLRAAFVVIFLVDNFSSDYMASPVKSVYLQNLLSDPLFWVFLSFVLLVGAACVFEPVLRMNVLVAWSTAIALQVKPPALALLAGFFAALVFHLTQVGALGALWIVLNALDSNNAGIFIFILLCIVAAALFYAFYIRVRRMSHNFIRRRAFAPD